MAIEVEAPGGVIVEFPDGTPHDVINGAMRKKFGGPTDPPALSAGATSTPTPETAAAKLPIYEIQTPAGKVLTIEAADEASAMAGARQWHEQNSTGVSSSAPAVSPTSRKATAKDSPLPPGIMQQMFPRYGIAAEIANGMTFGTLPNIEAGVSAGVQGVKNLVGAGDGTSMGDTYDKTLKETQDARRAFRTMSPLVAAASDATGGLMTGAGLVRNGITAIGNMANRGLSNLLPRILAGGIEGATYGAAAGAGGNEGSLTDRLIAAKDNMPLGAVVGGASIPITDLIMRPAANTVRNVYNGIVDPVGQGRDMLVRSIMRDRSSPSDLAQSVEAAAMAGQPEYLALDAGGRNTQKLAKMAARTPGEFRNDVGPALDARQGDAPNRIGGFIDEATGTFGPTARQLERGITQGRSAAAETMYNRAYVEPAPQSAFYDDIVQRPSVQDAMRTLERTAAERQMPLSDVFTTVPNPNPVTAAETPQVRIPTMRGWDMIKQSLDAQVTAGYNSADAAIRTAAGSVRDTRNALRQQLGADNPHYGAALARYGDDTTALEAIQQGRDLVRVPSDASREAFDAIAPAQRGLGSSGAAAGLREKLGGLTSGQDATRIFDTNNMRATLDQIAVDPVARAALGNAGPSATRSGRLGREQDMAASRRLMAGGSDTAENLSEQASPELLHGLGLLATAHPFLALRSFGGAAANAARGLNERSAQTIGNYLMENNPDTIRGLADLFMRTQARDTAPAVASPVANAAFEAMRQRPGRTEDGRQNGRR